MYVKPNLDDILLFRCAFACMRCCLQAREALIIFRSLTLADLAVIPNSGSIKANIGHLEGGSGLASILKSIMILETGIIPPNALFEKLNPKIKAKFYHLEVTNLPFEPICFKPRLTGRRCLLLASLGQPKAYDGYRSIRSALVEPTATSSLTMPSIPLRLSGW